MSDAPASGNYRTLLADRRLASMFALALIGRFGYAVLPLSLLFTIDQSCGSFALAATSSAAFGFACLAMPVQSRLLDRFGQRRVLPIAVTAFVAFLATVVVLALRHTTTAPVWIGLCLGGGLVAPALGPSTRAQWREATQDSMRTTAYALDAIAEESVFFLGPVAASAVLAVGPAWPGLVIAAVCLPIGVIGLITSPYVPARRAVAEATLPAQWLGPLRAQGFLVLLAMMLAIGVVSSAAMTTLAGLANGLARPAATGVVEAFAGLAAILGGWWWGRRSHQRLWTTQLGLLALARVPLFVACAALPRLWTVAAAVVLSGFLSSPMFVVAFTASDAETPAAQHTEASTWVTTTSNIGSALGTALAGWSFTQAGISWTFVGLAMLSVLTLAGGLHRESAQTRPIPAE